MEAGDWYKNVTEVRSVEDFKADYTNKDLRTGTMAFNAVLIRVTVLFIDAKLGGHFYIARKFLDEERNQSIWVCLDSAFNIAPFVIFDINAFLFRATPRSLMDHLKTHAKVLKNDVLVYGVKASFLNCLYQDDDTDFMEIDHADENTINRNYRLYNMNELNE